MTMKFKETWRTQLKLTEMTPADRHQTLLSLDWFREPVLKHQIDGETCQWYDGKLNGVDHSIYVGMKTGKVYPHGFTNPDDEHGGWEFEAFCDVCRNGWPVAKVAPAARGLFDGDEAE